MYWPIILLFVFVLVFPSIILHRIRAVEEGRRPTTQCLYGSTKLPWILAFYLHFLVHHILLMIIYSGPVIRFLPSLISLCLIQCLLFFFLPLLRKIIISRTCASLWTLLAFSIVTVSLLSFYAPGLWIIPLPIQISSLSSWLLYIWLAGFFAIMLWFIFSHFQFHRILLKSSQPITDEIILDIWKKELELAKYPKEPFPLYTSPVTQTPLSIGLFHRTTAVLLPEKSYSEDALKLILRHELIHICRYDALVKFTIMTFSAFLWFNPLMWISMRSCFNDLELSCDETVLFGYEHETRHRYATLLLQTAAEQRGFTTCLSASAQALRYRLKNVMKPKKRLTGGIIAGLFLCLVLCSQLINYSYNPGTIQEHIFQNQSPENYTLIDSVIVKAPKEVIADSYEDYPELTAYLFRIPVSPLMKNAELDWEADLGQFVLVGSDVKYSFWLTDDLLKVYNPMNQEISYYRVDGVLNWAFMAEQVSK